MTERPYGWTGVQMQLFDSDDYIEGTCWKDGPRDDMGQGCTCLLRYGHKGDHVWTSDGEIFLDSSW